MPQLDGGVVKARAEALREDGKRRLSSFLDNAAGSQDQILVEAGNGGHGRNFAKMRLEGDIAEPGKLLDVTVLGRDGDTLNVARR
ncbi:MAG: tRNA (N(6)-L-threonylcarbamoyladenosine(37)-C(2))-methylthiotransferase MtaB, partial [Pseudomonadota bacterium]|nr:tRNA (N(6)-L-threonylcarbamoyladenosine(37)-C(2))-methylthiotransferase MtaB [Pseudomonadota bacterium]